VPERRERGDRRERHVVTDDGVTLAVEESGPSAAGDEGGSGESGGHPPVVLLHGLTATRRYVTMGSNALQRAGLRTIAYDARAHGRSAPAPTRDAYGYERLSADLAQALDALGVERAVLAGASMGAHTALRLALHRPERVAGLGLITPSYDPDPSGGAPYGSWDELARGLREGGVEGFLAAYDFEAVPTAWRETVRKVVRQRLSEHEHPQALADALEVVPRSRPFERLAELASLRMPTLVVGSRDEADPGHPWAVARRYAEQIPGARLAVEEEGRSPLAWQGGQLSRLLAELTLSTR
jgi:pimeloyl-ACP methyl ester carboxylesterase